MDDPSTSGYAFPPSTNVLDRNSMPSKEAEAARQRAAEIMATLKKGQPGDADKQMTDSYLDETQNSTGLGGMFRGFHKKAMGMGKKKAAGPMGGEKDVLAREKVAGVEVKEVQGKSDGVIR